MASVNLDVGSLSGGNQQKVVIAKWLGNKPQILIMDEPTRGIDVNAKREIYQLMNELTKNGVAIIMVSSELPEVIGMSDRVVVIHEGSVAGILARENLTQEKIISLATGEANALT
jgi:ribose transport system ATP-binding protein